MTGCDACENEAAYVRKYSGQALCPGCFSASIERKAAKTISRYNMIRHGDTVAVGVSGGKDSLALLRVLHGMSASRGFHVTAVTIDEGIPGYRDEALGIVRRYCGELGVECMAYPYSDLFGMTLEGALEARGGEKASSCSICGTLRRRALDVAAADIGADAVATGHNLDDALQTFLINMTSGDTTKIGWTHPGSGSGSPRRIKPFCEIYESEIVFYAFTNGIPFQSEPCPHMNEGIRTEIREFLNSLEDDHSGIKNSMHQSVLRMAGIIRESVQKEARSCYKCGSRCTGDICSVCSTIARLGGSSGAR